MENYLQFHIEDLVPFQKPNQRFCIINRDLKNGRIGDKYTYHPTTTYIFEIFYKNKTKSEDLKNLYTTILKCTSFFV